MKWRKTQAALGAISAKVLVTQNPIFQSDGFVYRLNLLKVFPHPPHRTMIIAKSAGVLRTLNMIINVRLLAVWKVDGEMMGEWIDTESGRCRWMATPDIIGWHPFFSGLRSFKRNNSMFPSNIQKRLVRVTDDVMYWRLCKNPCSDYWFWNRLCSGDSLN